MTKPEQTQEVLDNPSAPEVKSNVVVNKNWYDDFEPDLKANPSITKFKNPAELGKSYVELQKALGKDKVVLPTDKSTPEEIKAFWKKIGAPDKDDEYDVSDEEMPEQFRTDELTKAEFRKAMHSQNFTKKQFDSAWKFYKESTLKRVEQETEKLQNLKGETETKLRGEWGAGYEGKVTAAQKVINTFFKDKGIRPEFSILANDTGFIKAMAEIGEKFGEDVIAGSARTSMTPSEAQSEYNTMLMDKKSPLHNELHPEHEAAVEKFADLQRLIMAGQAS